MGTDSEVVDLLQAMADPAAFARLRESGPVHRAALPGGLELRLVVRHAEALAALGDPRLSVASSAAPTAGGQLDPDIQAGMLSSLMAADPPRHTRLRKLVSSVFTARKIDAMRPWISDLVESLIDGFADRDEADLMGGPAAPLPVLVISELLGIPEADRTRFRTWSDEVISGMGTPDFPVAAATEFVHYLRDLVARKREEPDGGLLTALIQARDADEALSEDELTSTVFLLILAGHDTTLSLIGSGLLLLLTHLEQADRLRANPQQLPRAVVEFLRLESPVPMGTFRRATEAIDLGGSRIEAGETVMISLQSANRDESAFSGADQLDTERAEARHLAFGHWIHFCLGAQLARLEGELAIGAMLRRFPDLTLAAPPESIPWRVGLFVHGPIELPARLRAV
jgi:cytochrome P450